MDIVLQALLAFIAGCIYMIRGGSTYFISLPRWASALMQTVIIAPIVILFHITPWLLLIYPIGWYLTIVQGWGGYFDCKTWNHRLKFFARMLMSLCLFLPIALMNKGFSWDNIIISSIYSILFGAAATGIYTIYNKRTGYTDNSFNWSEFLTGALLAAMTFNLLLTGE